MVSPAVTNTEALEKGTEPGQHIVTPPQVALSDKLMWVDFVSWTKSTMNLPHLAKFSRKDLAHSPR